MAGFAKLHKAAIERCNKSEVTELVQGGTSVNSTDSNGMTILHYAACYGAIEMIKHLHQLGADVHARDFKQWTPLHHAVSVKATDFMVKVGWDSSEGKGLPENERQVLINRNLEKTKIKLVDCLLNLGADINATFDVSHHIDSPKLHNAIQSNNVQGAVKVLETNPTLANETKVTGYTALLQVIDQGQFMVMKHLVDRGADVNATYSKVPVLCAALESGNVEMVKTLLELGADIKCEMSSGHSPLTRAMDKEDKIMMKYLADHGANANVTYKVVPVLSAALQSRNVLMVKTLLEHGADVEHEQVNVLTALTLAITNRDEDMMKHLVCLGADVNATYSKTQVLYTAVQTGNMEILQTLLDMLKNKCKGDIDCTQGSGYMPLVLAMETGQKEMMKYLVDHGANVNATWNLTQVLYAAVESGNMEMLQTLLEHGGDLACEQVSGLMPLTLAIENEEKEMMRYLVDHGADVNATCSAKPALQAALQSRNVEILQTLLEHGKHKECEQLTGPTQLILAMEGSKKEMMEYLVDLGADVNATYSRIPVLYAAVESGNMEMLQTLLEHGLDVECRLVSGLTALTLAITNRENEMMKYLVDRGADVNATHSIVPVMYAALQSGNVKIVELLLDNWKHVERKKSGVTPLILAVSKNEKEMMKYLVHHGADVNATYCEIPVLYPAAESKNTEILGKLLQHDKFKEDENNTMLLTFNAVHNVILKSDFGLLKCLTQLGADLNIPLIESHVVHEAVKLGKPDMIKCLVEVGISKTCLMFQRPPIFQALLNNEQEISEYLVKNGADIDAKFKSGIDAIPFAASRGDKEMVRLLVKLGFSLDVTVESFNETTALRVIACVGGYEVQNTPQFQDDRLRSALKLGADVNVMTDIFSELHVAVKRGDIEMVETLARCGAYLNMPLAIRRLSIINLFLWAKIMFITEKDEDLFKALLEAKADVNSASHNVNPLFLAIEQSDKQMVKKLCEMEADPNLRIQMGSHAPLLQACKSDRADLLEHLIKYGADIHAEYEDGIEPLLYALRRGDKAMVQCLLDCRANRTVGTQYKRNNALNLALSERNVDAFECLLKAGCQLEPLVVYGNLHLDLDQTTRELAGQFGINISQQPERSYTLIAECLAQNTNWDTIQTLLFHKLNKPCEQSCERTTTNNSQGTETVIEKKYSNLHKACYYGDLDIVRLLIIDGSDVNETDSQGKIPFDYLPLASAPLAYDTLNETRTAEKVIERVGLDFKPILPKQNMEAILCTPGLGDVKCITIKDVPEISEKVLEDLCTLTKLEKSNIKPCGSSAEGTKVGLPDEMDFLVEINEIELGEKEQSDVKFDYVEYENTSILNQSHGSLTFHDQFYSKLSQQIILKQKTCTLKVDEITFKDSVHDSNRRATSALRMSWESESKTSHVFISVDVVPSLHVANSWPKDGRKKTWLLSEAELKKHGYYLVSKPPHARSALAEQFTREQLRTRYKISFPHLETYHMQQLEKRVKDVYVLAKCLRNPDVCRIMVTDQGSYPKNVDKYVTSYMLKMIFFENVEDFLSSDLSLGEMVCRVYDGVEEGLSKGSIPSYFMPKINAFGGSKMDVKKCATVAKIMKKFVHALYERDSRRNPNEDAEEEPSTPSSVYRCIEIAELEEMPETRMWDCEQSSETPSAGLEN